ncbi:MAG: class D sortase [Terracidiphilus sp.]|jgi:sortase A
MISTAEREVFAMRGQRFMRWARGILIFSGVVSLTYVALTLLGARLYQQDATQLLEKQILENKRHAAGLSGPPVKEGEVLGRLEIPRIGMSVIVLQGTTSQTLRLGVGHIIGTALPGETGNIGIAGHRDTYFRILKDIHINDEILLQTASGIAKYDVDWVQITDPADGGIVSAGTESSLTLVTCYPFHYIGAAPERFVVHAHRQ